MTVDKFSKATGEGQHGKHPGYSKPVLDKLAEFAKSNEGATAAEKLDFVRGLVNELKETIKSNPQTKINDILKTGETKSTVIESTGVQMPEEPKPAPVREEIIATEVWKT